jgi:Tfp pilus assembly protein PilF
MDVTNSYNKALKFYQAKKYDEAIKLSNEILQFEQGHYLTWNLLGNIFFTLNDFEKAKNFFLMSISLNPKLIEAYFMLGNVLFSSHMYEDSISIWEEALKINNNHSVIYSNIALSFIKLDNIDKAKEYLDSALSIDPKNEDAYIYLSKIYKKESDIINYKNNLLKAISINKKNPKTNFDLSYIFFLEKDYIKAYSFFEFRKYLIEEKHKYNYLPFKEYNFQNLENKSLLIYHEQGFGDNIQFIRFLNNIKCSQLSIGVQNSLNKLFSYNFPNINFKAVINTQDEYNYMLPMMSIPYYFKIYNINNSKYLEVEEKDILEFKNKFLNKNKLNIGIVWSGSKTSEVAELKNLELSDFESLFDEKNNFYSLQIDGNEETEKYKNIKILGNNFKNFYDTAVAICALDLIITIDTAIAHLTGALGQKGFVLSNEDQFDWRWDNIKHKSIWYDSIKVFKYSNIKNVIKTIKEEINEL